MTKRQSTDPLEVCPVKKTSDRSLLDLSKIQQVCPVKKTSHRSLLDLSKIRQLWHDHVSCLKCKRTYKSMKTYQQHKKMCHKYVEKQRLQKARQLQTAEDRAKLRDLHKVCRICKKAFPNVQARNCHMRIHKRVRCHHCTKVFATLLSLDHHQVVCPNRKNNRRRVCRLCGNTFPTGRLLYRHRMMQHGRGEELGLPFDSPPWVDTDTGVVNEDFRDAYNTNKDHILKPTSREGAFDLYNFATNNLASPTELDDYLDEIFAEQQGAFKVNLNFGFIMKNRETGDYRYYIPYNNSYLLAQPFLINNARDLQKLKKKLADMDPKDYILKERKNTKEVAQFITNINFMVTKLDFPLGVQDDGIPPYLLNNIYVKCFRIDPSTNKPYDDRLCFFRCLSMLLNGQVGIAFVYELYEQWIRFTGTDESFDGVELSQFPMLEECFGVNINLYELDVNRELITHYVSMEHFDNTLSMNLYGNHLMYITDLSKFARKFRCRYCDKLFKKGFRCRSHEKTCTHYTALRLPGGLYNPKKNSLFQLLMEVGIDVPQSLRVHPYFITYDFESLLQRSNEPCSSQMTRLERHKPISVAIHCNLTSYPDPVCFVDSDLESLLANMLQRMEDIQQDSYAMMRRNLSGIFDRLDDLASRYESLESPSLYRDNSIKAVKALRTKLNDFCECIPVVGFNSGKYDLNLIKPLLAKLLRLHHPEETKPYVIKRASAYLQIKSRKFKFLDMMNFLAPGVSYAKFLRAYGVEECKSYFPYDYLTNVEVLEETSLPPYQAFFSRLKNVNLLEDEWKPFNTTVDDSFPSNGIPGLAKYWQLKQTWRRLGMSTMRDFLMYYNVVDVRPFVEAIEKMLIFYRSHNICLFSSCIGIPGASRTMLFDSTEERFALCGPNELDLYTKYRLNITGGPSQVFTRLQETGCSMGPGKNVCGSIQGWDAVSLYLWCIGQEQPCGVPVRRKADNQFRPRLSLKSVHQYVWLDLLSEELQVPFFHYYNCGREKYVNRFRADGYTVTGILADFYGCFFHGCVLCDVRRGKKPSLLRLLERRYKATIERETFIRQQGYTLITIWECDFKRRYSECSRYREILAKYLPPFYMKRKGPVTERRLLKAVEAGEFYGVCEVDISVPDSEKPSFSTFPPIFGNCDIPFEQFGEHMQSFVESNGLSKNPRRLLVATMSAERILLATPLLRWYLQRGLKVTKLYEAVEYTPRKCFERFVATVTEARRKGDVDPNMQILGDTYKLIGNSAYGSTLVNKHRYRQVTYCEGDDEAKLKANSPGYLDMTSLTDNYYEVQSKHKSICLDTVVQVGFFILQYAKLRMLQFYYHVIQDGIAPENYNLLQMDTDSIYASFSGSTLIQSMRPSQKALVLRKLFDCSSSNVVPDSCTFFPRECCTAHKMFDKRTPGLFKLESSGDLMVCLCSKTYSLKTSNGDKFSMKGVTKRLWKNPTHDMLDVVRSKENKKGFVVGIRQFRGDLITYRLEKNALNYFYVKRTVLDDGITTKALDIVVKPRELVNSTVVAEFSNHPLSLTASGIYDDFLKSCGKNLNEQTPDDYLKFTSVLRSLVIRQCNADANYKRSLLATKDKSIIYCNRELYRYWTSGLSSSVSELLSVDSLKGRNAVGVVLMKVRDDMLID